MLFQRGTSEEQAGFLLRMAVCLFLAGVGLLFLMIIAFALPALEDSDAGGPFSWVWDPYACKYGILPMVTGSLLLSIAALVIACPAALFLAFGLVCAKPRSFFSLIPLAVIRLMTGIPTVVYGFAAVFLLTPLLRNSFGGSGFSWLGAAFMLALLILPSITLVLESSFKVCLAELCPFGLALGFSRQELLFHFVLPKTGPAFFSAALLGFGRAAGDTLIPLMLAGNAPHIPLHLTDGLRTLTAHMALVTANEVGGGAYNSLFTAGVVLLLINALVSLVLRRIKAGDA